VHVVFRPDSVSMQRVTRNAAIPSVAATAAGAVLAVSLATAATPARAVDGITIEASRSISIYTDIPVARVGLRWDWAARPFSAGGWYLGGYLDLAAGYWRNESDARIRTSNDLVEASLTPTLRWQPEGNPGFHPFIDAGVGLHALSGDSITTLRDLSGHLLFGSVLGVGLRLGAKGEYEIGYRVQHLSNGGLRQPNSGINLQSLRLHYHF
jgi:opacity protein-like surface antigen